MSERRLIMAAVALAFCAVVGILALDARHARDEARDAVLADAKAQLDERAAEMQDSIARIYEGVRTISLLPSVRGLGGPNQPPGFAGQFDAARMSPDAVLSVQQLYNNLASNVSVSEVYAVLDGFAPERGETPFFMFDEIMTSGLARHTEDRPEADADDVPEEVEDAEYAYYVALLAQIRTTAPTLDLNDKALNDIPAYVSPVMRTCDNTQYTSKNIGNVHDADGIIISVPVYGADTHFVGIVSAIVRLNVLEARLIGAPFVVVTEADRARQRAMGFLDPPIPPMVLRQAAAGLVVSDRRYDLHGGAAMADGVRLDTRLRLPLKDAWTLEHVVAPTAFAAKIHDVEVGFAVRLLFVLVLTAAGWSLYSTRAERARAESFAELNDVMRKAEAMTDKLIQNVEVGFFLIGPDFRVKPSYSRVCLELLKKDALDNLLVSDALGLSIRDSEELLSQLSQVFDDVLPEEVALDQVAKRIATPSAQLEVAVRVIRTEGVVSELLFTVHDIQQMIEAESENRENRLLLSLAVQKESFRHFLADAQASIRSAIEAIEVQRQEIARRSLHTIKGNSGFYGLDSLVATIHAVEDKARISLDDVVAIEDHLRTFVARIERVTGPLLSEADARVAISRAGFVRLSEALAEGDAVVVSAVARSLLAEADEATAAELLGPFDRACEVLARRCEKLVRVEVKHPQMRYSKGRWSGVFQNLVHLLRNAVDHGVEPPDERGEKPPEAVIRVEFRPEEILFSDDGRGIDVDAVVRGALARGAVSAATVAAMTRQEKLQLIFMDSVTTAATVTEVSGRGVGMNAVKEAIESAGGRIAVETDVGRGTTFRLSLGAKLTWNAASAALETGAHI